MNNINLINTEYITSSRTIETIDVSDGNLNHTFFIYNYDGISFRLFLNHLGLITFFVGNSESDFHFDTENELDDFLLDYKL